MTRFDTHTVGDLLLSRRSMRTIGWGKMSLVLVWALAQTQGQYMGAIAFEDTAHARDVTCCFPCAQKRPNKANRIKCLQQTSGCRRPWCKKRVSATYEGRGQGDDGSAEHSACDFRTRNFQWRQRKTVRIRCSLQAQPCLPLSTTPSPSRPMFEAFRPSNCNWSRMRHIRAPKRREKHASPF